MTKVMEAPKSAKTEVKTSPKVMTELAAKAKGLATAKPKKAKEEKVSDYRKNVIEVNQALKEQTKSLGYCRKMLLDYKSEISLDATHRSMLLVTKKNKEAYEFLKRRVRTSKAGNYSPFYLLQTLNNRKFQKDWNAMFNTKK